MLFAEGWQKWKDCSDLILLKTKINSATHNTYSLLQTNKKKHLKIINARFSSELLTQNNVLVFTFKRPTESECTNKWNKIDELNFKWS